MGRFTHNLGGEFHATPPQARSALHQRGDAHRHGTRTWTLVAMVAVALGVLAHSFSRERVESGVRSIQLQLRGIGLG